MGGMVGLRRAVARWWWKGIIGWALFSMSIRVGKRPSIQQLGGCTFSDMI
ncbi:MAG: hypothetical protein HQ580_08410 [Planctomycetes bacterium]|nr:hypothetical protein [Planctomycetota bacterium]